MGGSVKKPPTVEENVDNTNIGLLNVSENGLTKFGLGEILMILLLMLVMGIVLAYYCKKKKQERLREMEQSMRNSLGVYRPAANSELYPHRQAIPMVTFSSPGQRAVSFKHEEPSAPAQGLWEACR